MIARGYEVSFRVLKNNFQHEPRELLYLQAVMYSNKCFIYYIDTNEIPNHFTLKLICYGKPKQR